MLPLYMREDAANTISTMDIDPQLKYHALQVVLLGYTILRRCFPAEYCAETIARFQEFEAANQHVFAHHRAQLGFLPRVVNLHLALDALPPLFTRNTILLAIQDLLFGRPTSLYTSLFYERGSQQPPHRDTPVFCTRPEYLYFGNTVYLEAAGEENGCLEVIEGGHLVGELDREALATRQYGSLDDIPSIDNQLWMEYQQRVVDRCNKLALPRRKLLMEAGDAVIWHPQLPHGGSPIRDMERTRYSFVFHSTPVNVPVYHQNIFFHPSIAAPEEPKWGYRWVDDRALADHRNGIALGEPVHQEFPFETLNRIGQGAGSVEQPVAA